MVSSLSPHNLNLLCIITFRFNMINMALFCVAIRRDSVSLERFSFHSYVQVFWCEIWLVCLLKYPYSCFYSYFCFPVFVVALFVQMLLELLLAIVFSPSLLFLMSSSSPHIDESMHSLTLASPLSPPFLDTYSLSSFEWKTLYIIINFLVHLSMFFSYSF